MNRAERRRQERLRAKAGSASQSLSVRQMLDEAVAHHRGGRLAQAEQLYQKILQESPTHADSLHLLGLIAYQRSEYSTARALIDKAIQQDKKTHCITITLA